MGTATSSRRSTPSLFFVVIVMSITVFLADFRAQHDCAPRPKANGGGRKLLASARARASALCLPGQFAGGVVASRLKVVTATVVCASPVPTMTCADIVYRFAS